MTHVAFARVRCSGGPRPPSPGPRRKHVRRPQTSPENLTSAKNGDVYFGSLGQHRKLPRQADSSIGDCVSDEGLGRNVSGGTRPRLSWGRSLLSTRSQAVVSALSSAIDSKR